jgi:hypothetical protein
MSFIDPSAEFIDAHSKHTTAAQFKIDVEAVFAGTRNNNIVFTLEDVQIDGGKAAIYLEQIYHVEILHEKSEQWIPAIITDTAEESWEKKDGDWRMTRSKVLRHQQTVDPQWLAFLMKQSDRAFGLTMPCNFSFNGCR